MTYLEQLDLQDTERMLSQHYDQNPYVDGPTLVKLSSGGNDTQYNPFFEVLSEERRKAIKLSVQSFKNGCAVIDDFSGIEDILDLLPVLLHAFDADSNFETKVNEALGSNERLTRIKWQDHRHKWFELTPKTTLVEMAHAWRMASF